MPTKTTFQQKEASKIVSPARPEGGAGGRGGCLPGRCPAHSILNLAIENDVSLIILQVLDCPQRNTV